MTQTAPITYHITPISNPPTTFEIESYREVRLAALRAKPQYFSSTYEREAAFSVETWRERLTGSGKATFVAQASVGLGEEGRKERSGGYMGTVTVIAGLNARTSAIPPGADVAKTYFVYGMWVRPEHRRRGVGWRLMERMLAWAENDAKESASEKTGGDGDRFEVWLSVQLADEPARKLYAGLGFRDVEGSLEEHGELWMRRRLEVMICGY
ncbi:hypothetical protein V8D89_005704 [Ganoderma adspersum]